MPTAPRVLVGVNVPSEAEGNPAGAAVGQPWVQIGDVVLTGEDHCLLDVSYTVSEPGGVGIAVIRVAVSAFETVENR